jgi:hypothetical protein
VAQVRRKGGARETAQRSRAAQTIQAAFRDWRDFGPPVIERATLQRLWRHCDRDEAELPPQGQDEQIAEVRSLLGLGLGAERSDAQVVRDALAELGMKTKRAGSTHAENLREICRSLNISARGDPVVRAQSDALVQVSFGSSGSYTVRDLSFVPGPDGDQGAPLFSHTVGGAARRMIVESVSNDDDAAAQRELPPGSVLHSVERGRHFDGAETPF